MKILLILISSFSLFSQPHLLLHFDINKTLIASDLSNNKSIDAVLNEILAEQIFDRWEDWMEMPISFDSYVRQVLVPGTRDDLTLRKERVVHLHNFIEFLRSSNHPLYQEVHADYQAAFSILSQNEIFPSFFHLLKELLIYNLDLKVF